VRKSGIDLIGNVPWGTHFCQFYETKEDLIDILVPYFKAGLENNEFCMWVTSEPLGVEDARTALKIVLPDLDNYLDTGQIEIIPYNEWYTLNGIFDSDRVLNGWVQKLDNALKRGFDGLRLTGNTFWLEKEDWNDFVDYEAQVDSVLGNYKMIAMCTYCLDKCNANEIIDVVNNHEFALIKRSGKWSLVESSKRKKLSEELNFTWNKYDYLFNNMLDGYAHCEMIYDDNGNPIDFIYLNVNKAFEQLTGLKDVVGKKVSEVIPDINDSHPELFEIYSRVASTGKPERFEIEFKPLNIWLNIAVHQPKKNQFIAIFENITEIRKAEDKIKQSEARFQSVFNNSPIVIYRFNLQTGQYEYMSPAIRTLDFEPEELMAMNNEEVISRVHPEDRPALISVLSKINVTGKGESQYRFKGNNGKYQWWSNQMVIIYDSENKPLYRD